MGATIPILKTGLADGNSVIVDGTGSDVDSPAPITQAMRISELGATGACDIILEIDSNGDGTYDLSETIDSFSTQWYSGGNNIKVSSSKNKRIKIKNNSGGVVDVHGQAEEISQYDWK